MPLNAYVGLPRSGKSYEVVSVVILGSLRQGRRVVSNIAGLNFEAMADLLESQGVERKNIGQLIIVTHDDIQKPSFWRTDTDEATGFESFIQPGDLVALDEIWRYFARGTQAIESRAQNFFRMHGHMPSATTGYVCQIALITQSINDINRNIKDLIEQTFRMNKLSALGMNQRYRVDIFSTGSVRKPDFIRSIQRSYDKKYFPLYSSHSQKKEGAADADETKIDKRGNIFAGSFFRIVLPVTLILFCVCSWTLWKFFHHTPKTDAVASKDAGQGAHTPDAQASKADQVQQRVTGYMVNNGTVVAFVDGGGAIYSLLNPQAMKISPLTVELKLPSGDIAASYARREKSQPLGFRK